MKNIAAIITVLFCFAGSTLSGQNMQLEEIRITRDLNVNKLINNIANNFKKKRVGCYASKILHYRSVYSSDKCIEFNALQGVFFVPEYNWNTNGFFWNNSSNYNRVAPLTVFRSSPLNVSGELLEINAVIPKNLKYDSQFYKIGFNNKIANNGWLLSRTIDLFSPLNKKMCKYFNYNILNQYTDSLGSQFILLKFSTKEGMFPSKTKLNCTGQILYNVSQRYPVYVILDNYMDFYSNFVRAGANTFTGMASQHSMKLQYKLCGENLFLEEIFLNVNWINDKDKNASKLYTLINNPRRNPFAHSISQKEVFIFSEHTILNKDQVEELGQYFPICHMDFTEYYTAPFIEDKWKDIEFKYINFKKIVEDLNSYKPLVCQANDNALTAFEERSSKELSNWDDKLRFSKEFFHIAHRRIYPLIYNKTY